MMMPSPRNSSDVIIIGAVIAWPVVLVLRDVGDKIARAHRRSTARASVRGAVQAAARLRLLV